MFEALARLQLKRKGLSCGRTRRKQCDNAMVQLLWENPWIKALIIFGFFGGVVSLLWYFPQPDTLFAEQPLRAAAVAFVIFLAGLVQFYLNHPRSFQENGRVLLIFGSILVHLGLVAATCSLVRTNGLPASYFFLLTPFALAPMLLSILLGRHLGMFAAVNVSLYGALLVDVERSLPYVIVSLIASVTGVYVTNQIRRRSRLIRAGFYSGVVVLLLGFAVGYIDVLELAQVLQTNWRELALYGVMPIAVGIATATLIGGVLPMIESVFRITTEISWLELADLNHPLLRRMTIEAPGTYHHSLIVANLAEAAAEKIGGNATMCRVCSYFHDIGKLVKPNYCIENVMEGENPHDDLTPTMSTLIIMSHVKDGVDLAIKHKLNNAIIDVIEEHHGTSLVYYFYRRALDQKEEFERLVAEGKANEEDISEVDEKGFRYPGPKPGTRESAIISLADAVEGASRGLQKPTPQKIEQMVEEILRSLVRDGQLDECDLTMHELAEVKASFCATLRSMMHHRITYPKKTDEADDQKREERRVQGKATEKGKRRSPVVSRDEKQIVGSGHLK
ncbi:MAG: HD family phosphohydrolase [Verrucomicrobiales bacterium]